MKVHLAKHEPERMGGGWSFQSNLAKALKDNISSYEEADIYFIAGASMCTREEVLQAKQDGKKIVLRCDNIPRNSRNRGTAMTRMKDFADWADLVVYQTKFSFNLLNGFLEAKNATIIMNACDKEIFNTDGREENAGTLRYLYARSSSDETKNFEMARSAFQAIIAGNKSLTIVGKPFDPKLHEYNFDFFMGEKVQYLGEIHDRRNMAKLYKAHDTLLYSFFNDACSNTLIEAISCGMQIEDCYGMLNTGGAPEIINYARDFNGKPSYFDLPRMASEYYEALCKL